MRVFAVIMSLLTIFLSSYPCCQETDLCMETISFNDCVDDGACEDPHESEAPCSPFYTCGRCPGFTLTYGEFVQIVTIEVDSKINLVPYLEFMPKEVYFNALKPPRNFEV